MGEVLAVVGIMVVVVLAIFVWAAFIRKPPRKRSHTYHGPPEDSSLPHRHKNRSMFRKRHRRRRRRGEGRERPLNPTLAQVGGLPPDRREPPSDH